MIRPDAVAQRRARRATLSAAPIASLLLAVAILLSGCAIKLAPSYEESIVVGLSRFDALILTRMAAVADGTKPGLDAAQKAAYDRLEGTGRALITLIRARPAPQSGVSGWLAESLADRIPASGDASGIAILQVPTDDQVEQILKQLAAMEDEDLRQGLAPGQYQLYANAIDSFMRNALTYEMALKR